MNGSMRRASLAVMYWVTSKPDTSPANFVAKALTSIRVIGFMPLLPARIDAHAVATSLPTGETIPSPVTTTRRLDTLSSVLFRRMDGGAGAAHELRTRPRKKSQDLRRSEMYVIAWLTVVIF